MKTVSTIRAEVHFTAQKLDELQLKDRNIVVVDVLRSGTSIATAMHNGAKQIIPVNNIESAMKIAGGLSSEVTLRAGERNGKMIEGFNMGNSPAEFSADAVRGKNIIMLTTNGTTTIVKGRHARNLVTGGFVNLSRIVAFLAGLRSDFLVICAGKENTFSIEDAVCAGRILAKLSAVPKMNLTFNDSAVAAMTLDKTHGRALLKMLKSSEHGRYLTGIGMEADLKLCAGVDTIPALPKLEGTTLKSYTDQ